MPSRPNWNEEYWHKMDKQSALKIRTSCPKCGSEKTYYNEKFKVWRCIVCEHAWKINGIGSGVPWWKRLFGKK
jgi:ssDNA-binding Zn-finger/Zn-ribbon topoisomerase 1